MQRVKDEWYEAQERWAAVMSVLISKDKEGNLQFRLRCDQCKIEAEIYHDPTWTERHDWGVQPSLAGWIQITTGNLPLRFDTFHFCCQEHAAAWRAGKGKRRKIARVVEYGAEVKEIEL
jgi:hypothetical protein